MRRTAVGLSSDLPSLLGLAKTRKDDTESLLLLLFSLLWTSSSTFPEDLRRGNPLGSLMGIEPVSLRCIERAIHF